MPSPRKELWFLPAPAQRHSPPQPNTAFDCTEPIVFQILELTVRIPCHAFQFPPGLGGPP